MNNYTKTGVGICTILAIIISWSVNKSILWSLIHGFFGWGYILYYMIFIHSVSI